MWESLLLTRNSVPVMKNLLKSVLLLLFFGSVSGLNAQHANWREFVEQLAEEEEMNEPAIENMYEELLFLESNPMNLNRITRDQLERFPLLSMKEITAIMDFLEKNRPLYTVFELRNVPDLDIRAVERILPFFYVGETVQQKMPQKLSEILINGQSELQFRFDKTVTPRAGYGEFTDSILQRYPNRKYRGEDFYTSLRYSFSYRDKIQAGITAEKDAGEPFFKPGYTKGYDHYGFHLVIRDISILKSAAVGDYRLSFGQGLILNNDFMVSKAWSSDNVARRTLGPKRHFSTAESGFFRGVATVLQTGNVSITTFYSGKHIDANLSENGQITSLKTDGLHRTLSEREKKKNTREQVAGGNVNFRKKGFQVGISGLYHSYNRMVNPAPRDYNIYYLRDSTFVNGSMDYSWQLPGFIFAGETAISGNGAVATLHTARYNPSTAFSLTLLHRYYPITYHAAYAQAFSDGGSIRNEQGLFLGALFTPVSKLSVNTYIDFVRFPWLRYGVDMPSKGIDFYLLATLTITRQSALDVRYKYNQKEKNMTWPDENSLSILPYATHKLRFRYTQQKPGGWDFRTTADFARYKEKPFPAENGYMISQNISYRGEKSLTGDAYLAFFDAMGYNARLYSYERNLLNTFYMPSFYGKGIRVALSVKQVVTSALSVSVKAGHTRYFNRDTIGSGTELIDGNSRTDLFLYLRWQF